MAALTVGAARLSVNPISGVPAKLNQHPGPLKKAITLRAATSRAGRVVKTTDEAFAEVKSRYLAGELSAPGALQAACAEKGLP